MRKESPKSFIDKLRMFIDGDYAISDEKNIQTKQFKSQDFLKRVLQHINETLLNEGIKINEMVYYPTKFNIHLSKEDFRPLALAKKNFLQDALKSLIAIQIKETFGLEDLEIESIKVNILEANFLSAKEILIITDQDQLIDDVADKFNFSNTTNNDEKGNGEEEKIISNLSNENEPILSTFNFPEEIKVHCEQYLLYFAQFLQDLGINATSNLKEEAGKVLFSVTPIDDVEALDKIREALAVYLNLPTSPIIYDDSFAAMRLQQQIENLQHSQKMAVREIQVNEKLLLAQSDMIREKNLTISQQQTVIEQKDKIIEKISSKSIMMDSAENKDELEEIYDGIKIGESNWLKEELGIHLNPAKAIKAAVKNTFGKDEKKSVLGLNED